MHVPSAYSAGLPRGRAVDAALADSYVAHTSVGDPQLDPVMEELS